MSDVALDVDSAKRSEDATRPVLDVTVVLPAYNEAGHILDEIDRITAALDATDYSYEIVVIDDGSTDGTAELVRDIGGVRVIRFKTNRGSGTARRIGTSEAFGRTVVWTDADMTYPNERIPELVTYLEDNDVHQVVGARTSEQGSLRVFRVPAKWAIRRLAEYLTASRIPDLNSGLRAFHRDVALPYLGLLPPGFSCVTTITMSFLANGHDVDYVDIDYSKRAGKSHFHPIKDAYRYVLQVVRMVMLFEPLKVFAPISLFLLLFGMGKFAFDIITSPFSITLNTMLLLLSGLITFSIGLLADLIVRVGRQAKA